ncbi:hypothetical protein NBRC116588_09700 [Pyruvatibacter sp. HU-CL02332]|uniref:hypothetical protein n=1 Tax=Pyruvatibacter sp. HU-CL02332 TaxID=3127650 RepID=UPI003101D35E
MTAGLNSRAFDPSALAPHEGSPSARNCGRNGEALSKLHLVSRLSELDQDLSQRYINDSSKVEALKPQIESAARRLSQPPFAGADEYAGDKSSGLFGRKSSRTLDNDGESVEATSGLVPQSVRTRIDHYLQASAQNARQTPLHLMAILAGLLVFAGALFVDYTIVSEFWTRALANEFLELPGTLADSVGFKSLQVLFAAIAAHLVYASLGPTGQKTFTRIVFVFAVLMLGGLGFLLATMSLPAGTADAFGGTTSLDDALAGLGLGTQEAVNSAAVAAPSIVDEATSRDVHSITWLASLGVIFLVVTGVAAIALHGAVEAFKHLVAVGEYRSRAVEADALDRREHEYVQLSREIQQLEQPQARRSILWAGLMREVQAHLDGMDEARAGLGKRQGAQPVRGGFFSRGTAMQPVAESHESADDLRARLERNSQSMSVEAYEEIFDTWWSSRSQSALARDAQFDGPMISGGNAYSALPTTAT